MTKLELFNQWKNGVIDRRTFMVRLSALSAATLLPACMGDQKEARNPQVFTEEEWQRLQIAQEHLFPHTDDGPGAGDVNAAAYLQNVLLDPNGDAEEQEYLKKGLTWLEEEAQEVLGRKFVRLNADERERVLRSMAGHGWGERWISLVLLYIFEVLLADPLYGGNPDGVGWAWLDHNPGYPRPPADRIYGKLKI